MSDSTSDALAPADLLGPPPAARAQDAEAHAKLLARLIEAVQPRDFTERVLVSHAAYHIAQIRLLRVLEASLLKAAMLERVEEVLRLLPEEVLPEDGDPSAMAIKCQQGDAEAVKLVEASLAKVGLDLDALLAETFALKIDEFAAIKELISGHEKGYAAASREIEHHREALAEPVRAFKQAQDAEFEELRRGTENGGRL